MLYVRQKNTGAERRNVFLVGNEPFVCFQHPFVKTLVGYINPFVGIRGLRGFTLIELVVTLTIGAILLLIATPNITRFIEVNRLAAVTNEYVHDISLARSEAMKQGVGVGACPTNDGTQCTAGSWSDGWIVFADADDTRSWTASDVVLRVHARANGIVTTASSNLVLYNRQGFTAAGDYRFCSPSLRQHRTITINGAGQHRVAEGAC